MNRGPYMIVALVAACSNDGGDWVKPAPAARTNGPAVTITGVVRHFEIEDGFYAIRGDDSVTYDPTNLPTQFQKNGLRVEAVARRRDDMMSTRQVGPIVDLERIRTRSQR